MDTYTLSTVIPSIIGIFLITGAMVWGSYKIITLSKKIDTKKN